MWRAVGYDTEYGGFSDAQGPGGGDEISDGRRYGGQLAVRLDTGEGLSITPRVVYQKVEAGRALAMGSVSRAPLG